MFKKNKVKKAQIFLCNNFLPEKGLIIQIGVKKENKRIFGLVYFLAFFIKNKFFALKNTIIFLPEKQLNFKIEKSVKSKVIIYINLLIKMNINKYEFFIIN